VKFYYFFIENFISYLNISRIGIPVFHNFIHVIAKTDTETAYVSTDLVCLWYTIHVPIYNAEEYILLKSNKEHLKADVGLKRVQIFHKTFTDCFSGPGIVIGRVCAFVSFKLADLCHLCATYLAHWLILTLYVGCANKKQSHRK